ncbi:MAG: YbhN family protein [Halobacteriales archaeon]
MARRTVVTTLVGLGVAVVVLAVLVWVVGVAPVLEALAGARLDVVALVAGAILAWMVLWGLALWAIADAVGAEVGPLDAMFVHGGTVFANNVTPFGQAGGEPVGAWLLASVSDDAEVERTLAAMTSFDAVNVVPSLSFAIVGLGYFAAVTSLEGRLRVAAYGVIGLAAAVLVLAPLSWRYRHRLAGRLAGPVARPLGVVGRALPGVAAPTVDGVERRIASYVEGIELVAGDRGRLVVALGCSAAGWAVQALGLWLALLALDATVAPYVPLFVVPIGTIAAAMPTPGGLGGIEAVQVALLTAATGVALGTVTAAVLIFSVGGFLLSTSVGAAAASVVQVRHRVRDGSPPR